jgi:hypothetical protein
MVQAFCSARYVGAPHHVDRDVRRHHVWSGYARGRARRASMFRASRQRKTTTRLSKPILSSCRTRVMVAVRRGISSHRPLNTYAYDRPVKPIDISRGVPVPVGVCHLYKCYTMASTRGNVALELRHGSDGATLPLRLIVRYASQNAHLCRNAPWCFFDGTMFCTATCAYCELTKPLVAVGPRSSYL